MENIADAKQDSRMFAGRTRDTSRRAYPYLAYKESASGNFPAMQSRRESVRRPKPISGANGLVGGLIGAAIALFVNLNLATAQSWSSSQLVSTVLLIASGALVGSVIGMAIGALAGKIFRNGVLDQPELPTEESDIVVTLRPTSLKRRNYFAQDATRSNLG